MLLTRNLIGWNWIIYSNSAFYVAISSKKKKGDVNPNPMTTQIEVKGKKKLTT